MSIAISTTCNTARRPPRLAAVAAQPATTLTTRPGIHAYPLPTVHRAAAPHSDATSGWHVREEEGEYDIPDPMKDENFEPDRALLDVARACTEGQREAMALLDDAENLVSVLIAAIEDDGDSRAMQTEAVLNVVLEKLSKAYPRINQQEADHSRLFLAYFALKAQSGRAE